MRFGGAKTLSTMAISTVTFGIMGIVATLSVMILSSISIKAFGMMISRMSHYYY
jgi:hypothetical protein